MVGVIPGAASNGGSVSFAEANHDATASAAKVAVFAGPVILNFHQQFPSDLPHLRQHAAWLQRIGADATDYLDAIKALEQAQ